MSDSSGRFVAPRLLATIEFPVDKEVLLKKALEIDAPASLCDAISRLQPGQFHSRSELVAAIEAIANSAS